MSTMDRTVIEEFVRTIHRNELFAYVGTFIEIGDTESYNMANVILLVISFVIEFSSRIITFRRSRILSRLVEFGDDRLFLAQLECACTSLGGTTSLQTH